MSIENLAGELNKGTKNFNKARGGKTSIVPFVGLIVGTYDPNVEEAESIMRWFHAKPHGSMQCEFPMNLQVTYREFRRELEDGFSREELTANGSGRRREDRKKVLKAMYSSSKSRSVQDHNLKKFAAGREALVKQQKAEKEEKEKKAEEEKEMENEKEKEVVEEVVSEEKKEEKEKKEKSEELTLPPANQNLTPLTDANNNYNEGEVNSNVGGDLVQLETDSIADNDFHATANSPNPSLMPNDGGDRVVNRDNTHSPMTPIPHISTSNVTPPPPKRMDDAALTNVNIGAIAPAPKAPKPATTPDSLIVFCEELPASAVERLTKKLLSSMDAALNLISPNRAEGTKKLRGRQRGRSLARSEATS